LVVEEALEDLGQFNTIHRDYGKDLKQRKKNRELEEINRSTIKADLLFIKEERTVLRYWVEKEKAVLKQAKKKSSEEKKKSENNKTFDQPLRAKCDKILKKKGT
jgi:hypothetical protein